MIDAASLAKFFEAIVFLTCGNETVAALPLDAKRAAISVGRIPRAKINCVTANKKKVTASEFLATPHQSFDIGWFKLPGKNKSFFKLTAAPVSVGTKVFSLRASYENRNFALNSNGLVETCEHTKRGLTQLEALPAEERTTHPDQDYGLHLWLRYCELKNKPNSFDKIGTWRQNEIVGGTVLWADDKNVISSLPLGVVGAPVINEKGELIAMQTGLTPFNEPESTGTALSVAKSVNAHSQNLMREARKNGLWDY